MTSPAPDTLEREQDKLWVSDAELIRRLGVPEKTMRATLRKLDSERLSGFPQKQKLYGDRRYWPAVKAYFDRTYASTMPAQQQPQQQNYQGRRV